jgi:histidinol-phosphatase
VVTPAQSQTDLTDYLNLAKRLVVSAAEMALEFYGRRNRSTLKADGTPVGEADLAVDRMLTTELRRLRPNDELLSEESGACGGPSARRWIIDPIDGTEGFLSESPHWGTHLALELDDEIVLGVVSRPTMNRQWWALRGGGAFREDLDPASPGTGQRVVLSAKESLHEARITGWPIDWMVDPLLTAAATWFDCEYNDLEAVLEGRAEVVVVPGHLWDHAPFVVLLNESGGSLLDPEGGHRLDRGMAYYTNGRVYAELRAVLWSENNRPPSGDD